MATICFHLSVSPDSTALHTNADTRDTERTRAGAAARPAAPRARDRE